jgi:hypothetical protein
LILQPVLMCKLSLTKVVRLYPGNPAGIIRNLVNSLVKKL